MVYLRFRAVTSAIDEMRSDVRRRDQAVAEAEAAPGDAVGGVG